MQQSEGKTEAEVTPQAQRTKRKQSETSTRRKENRKGVVRLLLLLGIVLIGVSLLWSLQMPIIKRLWTCSMTLFSGGLCFLLMGLFYYCLTG